MALLFGWALLVSPSQPSLSIQVDSHYPPSWLNHVAFAVGVSLSDLKGLSIVPAEAESESVVSLRYEGGEGIGRVHVRLVTPQSEDVLFVTGNWRRDALKLSATLSEQVRQYVTARLSLHESRPVCGTALQESVIFLVDGSGSMDAGEKIPAMWELVETMTESLSSESEAALLAYRGDGCPANPIDVIVPFTQNSSMVIAGSRRIMPTGGTPLSMALPAATRFLHRYASSPRGRIIIISDGQNDCGDLEEAQSFINASELDITIESVAIDVEVDSDAFEEMAMIARAFGGRAITHAQLSAMRQIAGLEPTPAADWQFRWSTQGG